MKRKVDVDSILIKALTDHGPLTTVEIAEECGLSAPNSYLIRMWCANRLRAAEAGGSVLWWLP
jgi:DNA-binding Lrp family transcriptional regulator